MALRGDGAGASAYILADRSSSSSSVWVREDDPHTSIESALGDLFTPPRSFSGNFAAAKELARASAPRGLVVSIQRNDAFASHQMNRDTWKDPHVAALLESCVLWQRDMSAAEAAAVCGFYALTGLEPQTLLLHPRTGELLRAESGFVEPARMAQLLAAYLVDHCGVDRTAVQVALREEGGGAGTDEFAGECDEDEAVSDGGGVDGDDDESDAGGSGVEWDGFSADDDDSNSNDEFDTGSSRTRSPCSSDGDALVVHGDAAFCEPPDELPSASSPRAEQSSAWAIACAVAMQAARAAAHDAAQGAALAQAIATSAMQRNRHAPPAALLFGASGDDDDALARAIARSLAAASPPMPMPMPALAPAEAAPAAVPPTPTLAPAPAFGSSDEDDDLARAIALSLAGDGGGSSISSGGATGSSSSSSGPPPCSASPHYRVGELVAYESTVAVVLAVHLDDYTISVSPTFREKQTLPSKLAALQLSGVDEAPRLHRYREAAMAAALLHSTAPRRAAEVVGDAFVPAVVKVRLPRGERATVDGLRSTDLVAALFLRVAVLLDERAPPSAAASSSGGGQRLQRLEIRTQCV